MLIHGYGSNERDLFSLINYLPIDSYVISLRAPKELFNDSYAWYDIYLDSNNKFYDHDAAARVRDELFHFIDDLSKSPNIDFTKSKILVLFIQNFESILSDII